MSDRKEWGVIQELHIEADTPEILRAACEIPFSEHSNATHFRLEDGALVLLWAEEGGANALPYPLKNPDALYEFITRWLEAAPIEFLGEIPDTDGSYKPGYCIKQGYGCTFLRVKPTWIIYGK